MTSYLFLVGPPMLQCEAMSPQHLTPSRPPLRCVLEAGHEPVYVGDDCIEHNYSGLGPYTPPWDRREQIALALPHMSAAFAEIGRASAAFGEAVSKALLAFGESLAVLIANAEEAKKSERPADPVQ